MKKFTLFFIVVVIAEIISISNNIAYPWLEFISKPLIIISLFAFVLVSTKGISSKFKNWILLALFFSWMGDLFLMLLEDHPEFFMYGLLSFLISHVFYILAFTTPVHKPLSIPIYRRYPLSYIIPFGYSAYVFSVLKPGLGDMSIPVLIYIIVISVMLVIALNRYGKVNNNSYLWIVLGAFLFVTSDSILAFNKFHNEIEFSRYYIMITYMFAQFFIVNGAVSHIKEEKREKDQ
jgi:uncharacterized membrane protein YhhN